MILLQAAIGASLLIFIFLGGLLFIGSPVLTYVIFTVLLRKASPDTTKKEKGKILLKSILIAIASILILLFLFIAILSFSWDSRIN